LTVSAILIALSAAIIFALGAMHLAYTFRGRMLMPRDPALQLSMSEVSPVLTRETTMWKAWIGFNASHGLGALLFGLIYGYLALAHSGFLFQSAFLLVVGFLMLGTYAWLARRYWFRIPFRAIVVASVCYAIGVVLALFHS
jgi:hypothetical protein